MSIARLGRIHTQTVKTAATTPQPAAPIIVPGPASAAERGGTELIPPADAAELLGINAKVLERWRGTGGGPAYVKLSSKTIRYRRGDIAAFIAECVRASTAA